MYRLVIDRDVTSVEGRNLNVPNDQETFDMIHFGSMLTTIKLPWISQFLRYFFKPKPWFKLLLKNIAMSMLLSL